MDVGGKDNHLQIEQDLEENVGMNVEHEAEDVMEVEEVDEVKDENGTDKGSDEEDESSNESDSEDGDQADDEEDNPNQEDPPPDPPVAHHDNDHHHDGNDGQNDIDIDEDGLNAFDRLFTDLSNGVLTEPINSKVFLTIYRALLGSLLRFKCRMECALSINRYRHPEDINVEAVIKEYEAEEASDAPVTSKMFIHLYGLCLKLISKMERYVSSDEVSRANLKALDQLVQDIESDEGEGMDEQLTGGMFVRVLKLIFHGLGRVNEGMDNMEKPQNNKAPTPSLDQTGITYNWPLDSVKNFEAQEEHLKKLKEKVSKEIQDSSGNEYETLIEYIVSHEQYLDASVEGMISKILNGMFEVDLQQNFVFLDTSWKKRGIQIGFEGTQTYCLVMDCISSKHGGCSDVNFIRASIQKWWAHKKDRLRNFNDDDDEDSD